MPPIPARDATGAAIFINANGTGTTADPYRYISEGFSPFVWRAIAAGAGYAVNDRLLLKQESTEGFQWYVISAAGVVSPLGNVNVPIANREEIAGGGAASSASPYRIATAVTAGTGYAIGQEVLILFSATGAPAGGYNLDTAATLIAPPNSAHFNFGAAASAATASIDGLFLYTVTGSTVVETGYVRDGIVYATRADALAQTNPLIFGTAATEIQPASVATQDFEYVDYKVTTLHNGLAVDLIVRESISSTGVTWSDQDGAALPGVPDRANLERVGGSGETAIQGLVKYTVTGSPVILDGYLLDGIVYPTRADAKATPPTNPLVIGTAATEIQITETEKELPAATLPAQGLGANQLEEKVQASDYDAEAQLTSDFTQPAVGGSAVATIDTTLGFIEQETARLWSYDGTVYRYGTYTITGLSNVDTTTAADFTQPAVGASAALTVANATGFAVNSTLWLPNGIHAQVTAVAGNVLTVTNLGGSYNAQSGAIMVSGSRVILVGAGQVTLQRVAAPLSDIQVLADNTTAAFAGPVPTGAMLTVRSMFDRIPLVASTAVISIAAPRALINHVANPTNVNEIWQYSADAVRWQIGAGAMDDVAQQLGVQQAFAFDHLMDLAMLQFFSPIIGDGIQPYAIARYSSGAI